MGRLPLASSRGAAARGRRGRRSPRGRRDRGRRGRPGRQARGGRGTGGRRGPRPAGAGGIGRRAGGRALAGARHRLVVSRRRETRLMLGRRRRHRSSDERLRSLPSAVSSPASTRSCGLIGRGGMGSVWEGRHTTPGHARRHQVHRPRVRRQRGGARALRHRGARRGDDPEQARHPDLRPRRHRRRPPYIVMELLAGEPLDKRIERLGAHLARRDGAHPRPGVPRPAARARRGDHPPRPQAGEHLPRPRARRRRRDRQGARLRHRQDQGAPRRRRRSRAAPRPAPCSARRTTCRPSRRAACATIDHRTDLWSLGVIAYKCVTGVLAVRGRERRRPAREDLHRRRFPSPSVTRARPAARLRRLVRAGPRARAGAALRDAPSSWPTRWRFAAGAQRRAAPTSSQPRIAAAVAASTPRRRQRRIGTHAGLRRCRRRA